MVSKNVYNAVAKGYKRKSSPKRKDGDWHRFVITHNIENMLIILKGEKGMLLLPYR